MSDDRPVLKSDLDDLKTWLEKRFDKQDEQIAKLEGKVDAESKTNIEQEVRLNVVEGKVDGYGKWLAGVLASVVLLAIKAVFDASGA